MRHRITALLVLASFLSACAMGPDYVRPSLPKPEAWRDGGAVQPETMANLPWWELFGDPKLGELVKTALTGNHDLRIAAERILEAQAKYGYTRADLFPKVDAGFGAGYLQRSRNGIPNLPDTVDNTSGIYQLGGTLSWEIDLFGRLRRATEADKALFLASEFGYRAVTIALVGEVARTYFELRDLDDRIEIARRTLKSREEYVQLADVRFQGGVTAEIDLRQAEAEYRRTESLLLDFERQMALKEDALSVLLGRTPGPIIRGLTAAEQVLPPQVPAGIPSDLVDRRPDILQAEQQLVSENAKIGEAKAMLFPKLALTADVGVESTDLSNFISTPALAWSVLGNLVQPLFNAGKNRRRVDVAKSRQKQAVLGYQKAVLTALQEVEDSLVGYRKYGEALVSQQARVKAEVRVLELAELRYKGGVSSYLEVLDAQRSLFSSELDAAETRRGQLVAVVQLYKALGGGWQAGENAPPAKEPLPVTTPEVKETSPELAPTPAPEAPASS